MNQVVKRTLLSGLVFLMAVSAAACSQQPAGSASQDATVGAPKKVVEFTFPSYQVGADGAGKAFKAMIDHFNTKYEDQYQCIVEEIPGQQDYIEKLKLLNASDELPVLFDLGVDPTLAEMIIKDGKTVDLSADINGDKEWKDVLIDDSLKFNTVNGKLVAAPAYQDSYSGVYYNKEIFAAAGIDKFPDTWDGLLQASEKISAKGTAPFALMTGEDGWTTMLPFTAYIATQEGGLDFMYKRFPTDFNIPAVENAATYVQKMFKYTTVDAIGATYAIAANNFVSGKAAMLPNGPWIMSTFLDTKTAPNGFSEKVGYAIWPGGVVHGTINRYGFAISNSDKYTKEQKDGALALLHFMSQKDEIRALCLATGAVAPKVPLSEEEISALPPLYIEAYTVLQSYKVVCPNYSYRWDTSIVSGGLAKELPLLADGTETPKQFCTKLTELAQKAANK